jgi:hypothetical protein
MEFERAKLGKEPLPEPRETGLGRLEEENVSGALNRENPAKPIVLRKNYRCDLKRAKLWPI